MKRAPLFLGMLGLLCAASTQTKAVAAENVPPELQARIRELIATLGPDPTRGTCMPNPGLPTNLAQQELIAIGKPATLPLCAVLTEKDVWRRLMAIEVLTEIRDPRAIPSLLQTLQNDPEDTIRGKAAEAMGGLHVKAAVPALLDTLKIRSKDPVVFFPAYAAGRAALALGQIGDRRAIPALLSLLGSDERTICASGCPCPLGEAVAEVLGKFGTVLAEPLMQLLRHSDQAVRIGAAKALGVMKERRAVPLLLALLTPPVEQNKDNSSFDDFLVSVEAIKALGEIGDKRAVLPLLKRIDVQRLLENANEESSVVVIEALGKLRDTRAVETLFPLVASEDGYVQWRTLEALWRIKTPKIVKPLIYALQQDDDPGVRYRAAEWLGQMRERHALPALNRALEQDDDTNVSYAAAVAIGRIDSNRLLASLQDKDEEVRRYAVLGLGEVEDKRIVSRLLAMIGDKKLGRWALVALGKLGTPALLPRLEPLMRDSRHNLWAIRAVIAIKQRYKL